jgi:MoxR-like ATPase
VEAPVEPAPAPIVNVNVHIKISFESVGNLFKLRGKSLKGVYMPVVEGARHPKVPDIDPDFFFNYEKGEIVRQLAIGMNEAYNVDSRRHVNSNVWIWGHRGAGKSELINQIGARCNRPVFVTSCHRELTVETLAGEFDPRSVAQGDSVTALLNPEFVQGVSTPNAIVVLDEMARVQPSNGVGFNGCFERRIVNRQDGTSIKFAQGVTLIVTDNTNGTGDPTGLYEAYAQDASLLDRFRAYIHLPFLPPATEAKVLSKKSGICAPVGHLLVKIANAFRGACKGQGGMQARSLYPSLRGLTSCAEYVLKGVPFRSAIGITVTGNVIDSDRDVSLIIVDAHAPSDEEVAKVISGEQSDFTVSVQGNDATPADIDPDLDEG